MGSSSLSRKWDKISLDVSGFRMASIVIVPGEALSPDSRDMLLAGCWLLLAACVGGFVRANTISSCCSLAYQKITNGRSSVGRLLGLGGSFLGNRGQRPRGQPY